MADLPQEKTYFVPSAILFSCIWPKVFLWLKGLIYDEVWPFGSNFQHEAPHEHKRSVDGYWEYVLDLTVKLQRK